MPTQEKINSTTQPSKEYYILLVGINDYQPPISPLSGCLNDLNQIEQYIFTYVTSEKEASLTQTPSGLPIKHIGNVHLCRLENQQATYQNIIQGFREHLQQARPDDVVWFHFSGHGAEQFTAEEFLNIEPNGKDQTLVCYANAPQAQVHLADKELAALLYETENAISKDANKKPHIVVSLDCCHSGSGTRDFEINPDIKSRKADLTVTNNRAAAAENKSDIRSLDSYVGNYVEQWTNKGHLEVPLSSHVLLSACESVQLAGDLPVGGVFTSGLINALKAAGGNISYSDLYMRTKATVQHIRKNEQTPQFDTIGEFDPYTRFLEGSALGSPKYYNIIKQGSQWMIKCGAIHGIPLTSKKPTQVEIRTINPENEHVGWAEISSVGAHQSALNLKDELVLSADQSYQALIKYLPAPPILVWVHGEEKGIESLGTVWDESKNIKMVKSLEEFGEAQLEVEVTATNYKISDRRTGRLAMEWPTHLDNANHTVIDMLEKMVNWERTISLQNEKSAIKDWFNFEIDLVKDPRNPFMKITEDETIIQVSASNFIEKDGALIAGIVPYFKSIEKPKQNLYIYLLHLRSNYAISCYEGEVVYRVEEHQYNRSLQIPLLKKIKGWGLSPDEKQTTGYFKLLVTTEALQYQQLLQSGLDGDRATDLTAWNPFSVENDWYCKTLKVVLERLA